MKRVAVVTRTEWVGRASERTIIEKVFANVKDAQEYIRKHKADPLFLLEYEVMDVE